MDFLEIEHFSAQDVESELAEFGIPMEQFVELEGVRDSYSRDIVLDWIGR